MRKTVEDRRSDRKYELEYFSNEWNCSIAEVARKIIYDYYSSGLDDEILADELYSKSDKEIIGMYLEL